MNFLHLLKTMAAVLPLVLICIANIKINLHKANRVRQFAMPFVAVVYGVLCVVFLEDINTLLYKAFVWLGQHFTAFQGISWQSTAIYILNAVFVVGFIVLKSVLLPVLNKIWQSNKLCESTSGYFYEYDDTLNKWFLMSKFANFRGFIKGFYIASFVVSMVVFVLSQNFKDSVFFRGAFYPVLGIILLSETIAYLSGITRAEFVEDILGEDEESNKIANYGALREILRGLFGDRVLYDSTIDTSDGISTEFEELDELSQSTDRDLSVIASYFLNLKKAGEEIDINYVKSAINLYKGKSTLFCNPFYRDLTYYVALPLVKQLISYKKGLIVLGRDSALDDVKQWIDDALMRFSHTDSLWKSKVLDESGCTADVGIIRYCDIHNFKIHKANRDFLKKVGFVILMEPSRLLTCGQLGLSLIVNDCEKDDKEVVFCAFDRNCDGLVDALSHILKTSITEVTATETGGGNTSQMFWNTDGEYMHHKIFPNISRYLGIGTEINAVALKYQVSKTDWIGSDKFPVVDMKWIAGQYHRQICQYADLPESQSSFDRAFNVNANLWNSARKDNSFLVVEDEFNNLFEMSRVFASRSKKQGFVNVISENYFLRDYMVDNVEIFSTDPKAIPTIVPDYARTERNTVFKLIMMMLYEPVSEERIAKELTLCGLSFEDPYAAFISLVQKHCSIEKASLSARFKEKLNDDDISGVIIKYYELNEANELYEYARSLRNAYYIAEDEEGESHYIGSKLYMHVFQAILPGQFMTNDGKYYEVMTVTPSNGVVLRRAADHITGRHYYKQLRRITISNWTDAEEMGSRRTFSDVEINRGYANISVETDGYMDMNVYGDIAHAKKVLLSNIPERHYTNKNLLKIRMPDECTPRILYTVCILLNEIFRTTYPETYHYISAVTPYKEEFFSEKINSVNFSLSGDCDENCIYIIEDSDIDMGLIVSVERNFKRYLEIAADVIDWHRHKMTETPPDDDEPDDDFVPDFGDIPEKQKKSIMDFWKWLISLFGIRPVKKKAVEEKQKKYRLKYTATDDPPADIDGDDDAVTEEPKDTMTEYQKKCFLKFGFDDFDDVLDIDGTWEMLQKAGFDKNPLKQVRQTAYGKGGTESYDPHKCGAHLCDFCGVELLGGEYELLKDGRERCNRCSMTALKTVDDFRELYKTVQRNMEAFYGIKLNVAIRVRTTNAKKIAKHVGMQFVPTPGFDGRVLGFAQKDKTGYSLYIENGSPKLAATGTIVHELTHIWQYLNWNEAEIELKYGKQNALAVYEGMAMWSEVQYLMLMNEKKYAKRMEITTSCRNDEYGIGFNSYLEKYPLTENTSVSRTPFKEFPPL
jgi:hypothetical protein